MSRGRLLRLIRHAAAGLLLEKGRASLAAAAIGLSIALFVAVIEMNEGVAKQGQLLRQGWKASRIVSWGRRAPDATGATREVNSLTMADYEALKSAFSREAVFFGMILGGRLQVSLRASRSVGDVRATDLTNLAIENREIDSGFALDEDDMKVGARNCVLGAEVAKTLGDGSVMGSTVLINGTPFRVKGTLKRSGPDVQGNERDSVVYIPLRAGMRMLRVDGLRGIGFVPVSSAMNASLAERITGLLRDRHGLEVSRRNDFEIESGESAAKQYREGMRHHLLRGIAMAGIAAAVGGAVMTNVLLMAVARRRAEIGLKRSLGATRRDVSTEFMAEALLLCLAGAVVGTALGGLAAVVLPGLFMTGPEWSQLPMNFSWRAAAGASLLAIALGLLLGVSPARRAAAVAPVRALKS